MSEIADVERTLEELIELGGETLLARWPGVRELRRLTQEAATAEGSRRDELVEELNATADSMYGRAGSFTDYGIDGPGGDRFERLKDQLSRQIGRLL